MINKHTDDDSIFETVLDVDGKPTRILRDGARLRIPLTMRDAALREDRKRRQRTTYDPQGRLVESSEEEEEDTRDSARRGRDFASPHRLSDQELASCRPGFRYGGLRVAADRQALYDAYDAEASRAYLTPAGFGGDDPARTGFGSHGFHGAVGANPPAGAYPYRAEAEGAACTVNGAPGTLQKRGNWLVCVANRDEDDNADDDADADERSVALASSDHQKRMAKIYDALDQELADAFRNVKP
jgi:hypothetical protein